MQILNENEFENLIKDKLSKRSVFCSAIESDKRKTTLLKQDLFFDLSRNHHKHSPDLCITPDRLPCELKSPKELYDVCRYSRAHLYSYLLQTIYGQCYSYADLFRPNDARLSIFLMIPKTVRSDLLSFNDIENVFKDILTQQWPSYVTQMELARVEFMSPDFVDEAVDSKYGKLNGESVILLTKITYVGLE